MDITGFAVFRIFSIPILSAERRTPKYSMHRILSESGLLVAIRSNILVFYIETYRLILDWRGIRYQCNEDRLYFFTKKVLGMAEKPTYEELEQRIQEFEQAEFKRKRTEKELQESEERYRSLVELFPEAILVHQDWKIVYINPEGAKIFGAKDSEEIIGTSLFDYFPSDYHELVRKRTKQVYDKRKTVARTELKLIRLDETIIDIAAVGTVINYLGNAAALSIIKDITDQLHSENELRQRIEAHTRQNSACVALASAYAAQNGNSSKPGSVD